jgi:hypothetical protein
MEVLESSCVRPRQARYQAALRPDMKCIFILKHFATASNRYQLQLLLFTTVASTQTVSDARLWS